MRRASLGQKALPSSVVAIEKVLFLVQTNKGLQISCRAVSADLKITGKLI